MNIFYVYIHISLKTGEVFYVGKGKKRRAFARSSRNKIWESIAKEEGFRVDFVAINLLEKDALDLEIEQIQLLHPKANLTGGGQGTAGYKFDKDLVIKRNERNRLLYNDPEWVKNRNESLTEAMARPEVREKLLIARRKLQEEIDQGLRPNNFGKKHWTEEERIQISLRQKGEKAYWFGKEGNRAKSIINTTTNQVFRSLKDAAASVNGNYRSLLQSLKKNRKYKKQWFKYNIQEKQS